VLVRGNNPAINGFITDVVYDSNERAAILSSRTDFSGNDVIPMHLATRTILPSAFSSPYIADIEKDGFSRVLIADNAGSSIIIMETGGFTIVDSTILVVPPQSVINWY